MVLIILHSKLSHVTVTYTYTYAVKIKKKSLLSNLRYFQIHLHAYTYTYIWTLIDRYLFAYHPHHHLITSPHLIMMRAYVRGYRHHDSIPPSLWLCLIAIKLTEHCVGNTTINKKNIKQTDGQVIVAWL